MMLFDKTNRNSAVAASTARRAGVSTEAASSCKGPGALVIGGGYRALGAVRSLGRHGISVWVLSDNETLATYSRYVRRSFRFPDSGESEQLNCLFELGAHYSLDGWALFPTDDEVAALLARNHDVLEQRFRVTVPPWQTLKWAYDKRLTHRLAERAGVAYPWTMYPRSRADLEQADLVYPVILKPAIKRGRNPFYRARAWAVRNRDELLARYDAAARVADPEVIMVQELIPGNGESQFSYAALAVEGYPIVSLVARRTRQYPLDFGRSSSYVETIDEPEVDKMARALLTALSFTGLVQVQFKRDPRNGQFKLLDINPRIWGSHTLSRRFGGDFPYLLWRLIHNEPVPEVRVPAGIHWVRAASDLRAGVIQIWNGQISPSDYVRSLQRPLECAILASDDPLPAVMEIPLLFRLALERKRIM